MARTITAAAIEIETWSAPALETNDMRGLPAGLAILFASFIAAAAVATAGALPLLVASSAANVHPPPPVSGLGSEVKSDFEYLVNNTLLDAEDVVTSPLYVASPDSALRSPRFYLVLAGAGAIWGGSFTMDQTIRSHLRSMSSSDADLLQNISYGAVGGATALLYGYGLYADDARAREYALTAGEGAGIAALLDLGIKAAFGRLRPSQTGSHTAFFHGGRSFVSGDVAPVFALAAGVSEYYDNRWYVAAPVYSLALLDGFGRMGHDAHWFSDVVGAALLGVGTTELFLWLHQRHETEPSRWRIFSMGAPAGLRTGALPSIGVGMSYDW